MRAPYRKLDRRITYSQRSCAQSCLRKHALAYVYGIRRRGQARPLRMGSVVHDGIDLMAKGDADAVAKALAPYDAMPDDEGERHAWLVERETCGCLLTGYQWYWQDAGFSVVESEQTLTAALKNMSLIQAGKVDRIVRMEDGRLAVLETKTTSEDISDDSDYWKRLRIDGQISDYIRLARMNGFDVSTVIYDVIRKPTIRPNKVPLRDDDGLKIVLDQDGERVCGRGGKWRQSASSKDGYVLQSRLETAEEFGARLREDITQRPEYYYQRREIPRISKDLEEASYDLHMSASIIQGCHQHRCWPRNTRQCLMYGRCEYFDLCTSGFEPDEDDVPEGYEIVDSVHRELDEDQ